MQGGSRQPERMHACLKVQRYYLAVLYLLIGILARGETLCKKATIQPTLAITDLATEYTGSLAIPTRRTRGFKISHQQITPRYTEYQTAIQYRTGQSVKVFISLFSYISPLL